MDGNKEKMDGGSIASIAAQDARTDIARTATATATDTLVAAMTAVANTPLDYSAHLAAINAIKALRDAATDTGMMREELRQARETMVSVFPLSPGSS